MIIALASPRVATSIDDGLTKNQLDPTEEAHYVPGEGRRLFDIDGCTFGIAICHEGFRYPETVRWAAVRGAQARRSLRARASPMTPGLKASMPPDASCRGSAGHRRYATCAGCAS
jgi:hypothetical protein